MSAAAAPRGTATVLPITRGGLELTDRVCAGILGVAMAASAGLILYLNRDTTFFLDEVRWVYGATGLDLHDTLTPHNGHLVATTRVAYLAILEAVGAEYVAFRALGAFAVLLSAGLFYALVKRWIGVPAALAPTLVLLFFGSAWQHVVVPVGFSVVFAIALGLGALLALERDDRAGDVAACALTVLALATYTTGVPFLVAVTISVLIRADRRSRAWVFLVPLALYAAWLLWSSGSESASGSETSASNLLLVPAYVAESLAVAASTLTGLDYHFGAASPLEIELAWGRVVAVVAVGALVVRIRRGGVPTALWFTLGAALSYWLLGALAFGIERGPDAVRYVYPGGILTLLVAAAAIRGMRLTNAALVGLFAAAAISLGANVALLRDGAALFRESYSAPARAQFAMLELARGQVADLFDPVTAVPEAAPVPQPDGLAPAGFYLAAADRFGSPAFTLDELARQSEDVREGADQVLARALRLRLDPVPPRTPGDGCRLIRSEGAGKPVVVELPRGGATLRAAGGVPGDVHVGRFASTASAPLGGLAAAGTVALRIPADHPPVGGGPAPSAPWRASISGARAVEVCPLP